MTLHNFFNYVEVNCERFVEELRKLLRQPSVSAQDKGVKECALLLRKLMEESGIETRVIPLPEGQPVVYGEVKSKASKRTLLVYSHYDVQPPEPLNEWVNPPFEAEVRDGAIYARGASDSKGNIMAYVKAVEAFLKTMGDVPVNLKFLFEGEEEVSSTHLPGFIAQHKGMLEADAVVCCDGGMDPSGRPTIDLGLKGILYVELRCIGAGVDLHSSYAPLVKNPAWRILWALATVKSLDERITVEGWYDRVQPPSPAELQLLNEAPFNEEGIKKAFGLTTFLMNRSGSEAFKALICEPTCTICGFEAGYTGSGSKTVLPSTAMAKIDFRLVYDQSPSELLEKLKRHLVDRGFGDVEVVLIGFLEPSKTPLEAHVSQTVIKASEKVYGVKPVVYPNAAGSGPDYLFTKRLGLASIWTGCAPPFSKAHAPNEFITIHHFVKGIMYAASIMYDFGSN